MLPQLTRRLRWRWARVLAATYLVCMLAPGFAFAFGDGVAANCALAGVHAAATTQQPASGAAHADHHHGGAMHQHPDSVSAVGSEGSADHSSHHSDKIDKMCCGLACQSALPARTRDRFAADFVNVVEVSLPAQALATLTPPRLYKPPIA